MARFCRYCGSTLPDGAGFCGSCGKAVPKEEPQKMEAASPKFCRNCGKALNPGAQFCRECGWKIGTPIAENPAPAAHQSSESDIYTDKAPQKRKAAGASAAPRSRSIKPLIAAVLAAAVFVCFVYPGFVRTGLSGGKGQQTESGKENGSGSSGLGSLFGGGKDTDSGNAGEAALPSPEELAAEYASINEAYADGSLFAKEAAVEDPHAQYNWLYDDESGWEVSEENEESNVTVLPEGKSKAFRTETPYGITISAEENALDQDREFKVEPVSAEQYDAVETALTEAAGGEGLIMGAWELDAGMADDEVLPGSYTMEFDLEQMGLEESDFDNLQFYRIDDAGRWYPYQAGCSGNTVTIEANQNSIIGAVLLGLALTPIAYDAVLGDRAGAYFNPFTGTFDLKYNDKKVMQVMLDRKSFLPALEAGNNKLHDDLVKSAMEEAYKQIKKEENLDFETSGEMFKELNSLWASDPELSRAAARIKKNYKKRFETILKQKEESDPDYMRIKRNLEDYKNNPVNTKDLMPELEAVDKVCESALRAWKWLKEDLKLNMPKYQFRIELSGEDKGAYGATQAPVLGNPYMVISMAYLGRGDSLTYDRLLCTVCHELFHAVQRVYVSNFVATYKFDEMSAQDVEEMAFDHFSGAEVNPITSSKEDVLENLTDAYWFAVPINDFKTTYPEGTISGSGDQASASYPVAPIVTYLRKDWTGGTEYSTILSKYKGLWGKRAVTTILKEAFSLKDDEKLTEAWHGFAKNRQTRFYKEALKPKVNEIFAPLAEISGLSGKREVQLSNKNYTIRVRRVKPQKLREEWKQYALVLKYDESFKDMMSDFEITPLNKQKEKDFREYADGLFFEPKEWADDETVYLMEADGGTADTTEGMIWNSYSGYTLYEVPAPEKPEVTASDKELSVKLPIFGEWPGHEITDSYVITLRTGKTDVLQQQVMKADVDLEPVKVDISDLKINGKKLDDEQRKNLVLILQYCVEGTFKTEQPCLGPESDPVPLFNDIYGTWEIISHMQEFNMPMLDGLVQQQGQIIGSLGGQTAQEAIDSSQNYVNQYFQIEGEAANSITKGIMILRPGKEQGKVEAMVQFEGAPEEYYDGIYEASTMHLTLNPTNTQYSFTGASKEENAQKNDAHQKIESGTYDLAQYGLAASLDLDFFKDVNEKDPDHPVMTFSGITELDNQYVKMKSLLSGTKLSDALTKEGGN